MTWIDWAMIGIGVMFVTIFGSMIYTHGYDTGYKARSAECANNGCSMGPLGR